MSLSRETAQRIGARLMPHVEQHDPFTYLVQSRTKASRKYLVSIAANWGNGKCTCTDFEARRNPVLRKTGVQGERNECWHIKQAKRYWALITIFATAPQEALAEGVLDSPPETHEETFAF